MPFNLRGKLLRARVELAAIIRGSRPVEDYTMDQRRSMWPLPKMVPQRLLDRCKLIESRVAMLDLMPKGGVCAEIGIFRCDFSSLIIEKTQPRILHLIDIDSHATELAHDKFRDEISYQKIKVHLGNSPAILASMPDQYFDWLYIDGDHTYEGAKADLEATLPKIKDNGVIALNDYVFFAPMDFGKYGVVEAVNEFCIEHDFEMIYFALAGRGYHDVALRRA
jgi:hypothetical protein